MRFSALLLPIALGIAVLSACSDRGSSRVVGNDDDDRATAARASSTPASREARTPTATPGVRATPTAPAVANLGPAEHDGVRTLEHIRQLSEVIGERVSGTAGEDRTVAYVRGEFERLGYAVEVMPFDFSTGGFVDDSLTVGGEEVASRRFNGTATKEVQAQALYVGTADDASLQGKGAQLRGKIALVDRGGQTFSQKWAKVENFGAVGMIVINSAPGLFAGRLQPEVDSPIVGVDQADGPRLIAAAAAGKMFVLSVPAFHGANVIARPSSGAKCAVLVGGHHDTVPNAPGATDNASGSATVLELARAFASDGLDAGLCFATFGGEESGLHGSAALARRLQSEKALPAAYVNLDVTGTGSHIEVIGDRSLVEDAVSVAGSMNLDAVASSEPAGSSSDHASFKAVGVAVVFLAGDDYSKIHTSSDTIATINPELLEDIGDLAYAVTGDLLKRFARG